MPVIVTRPREEALRWVQRLRSQGVDAVALPLIDIAPPRDESSVREAWKSLASFHAAMFVSANAVRHFFALAPPGATFGARAWATGPGTSSALRAGGVSSQLIDEPASDAPQFDSEALWQLVAGTVHPGQRMLIVRGADASGRASGRDWLADQLASAGVMVDTVVAYCRVRPSWSADELAVARRAASDGSTWLFSSSEAIHHLRELLPDQSWRGAHALATHPRIADAAREAGFADVGESRPAFEEVLASLQSGR